jgi:hypothetical protein
MLNERITGAERVTLIGLAQVTQRTDKSAQLRFLKSAEISTILSRGTHDDPRSTRGALQVDRRSKSLINEDQPESGGY